ncbi:MAG TPA: hypothetical protein VKQ11_00635 [Candidatus Sulfotelmatobacter sp.]|nr:hypothetical protein [Candidatus Sulfotelmatobacter sp.]
MTDLRTLDTALRWLVAALWAIVLVQRLRNGDFLAAPLFACYLAAMSLREALNLQLPRALFLEPTVLSLRFCATLEAVSLCLPRRAHGERRWLVLMLLEIGAATQYALYRFGYPIGASLIDCYAAARQYFHVAMAFATFTGIVLYALEGRRVEPVPRAHYLIVTAHLWLIAVIGFLYRPTTGTNWRELHIWYLAGSCACLACWWMVGGTVQRFNLHDSRRPTVTAE